MVGWAAVEVLGIEQVGLEVERRCSRWGVMMMLAHGEDGGGELRVHGEARRRLPRRRTERPGGGLRRGGWQKWRRRLGFLTRGGDGREEEMVDVGSAVLGRWR